MARKKQEVVPEIPTVVSLLQITGKIAESQGMKAWQIMSVINQVLHFPLNLKFEEFADEN